MGHDLEIQGKDSNQEAKFHGQPRGFKIDWSKLAYCFNHLIQRQCRQFQKSLAASLLVSCSCLSWVHKDDLLTGTRGNWQRFRDLLSICRRREFICGRRTELKRTDILARDPALICLGRGYPGQIWETKRNKLIFCLLLRTTDSPEGGVFCWTLEYLLLVDIAFELVQP